MAINKHRRRRRPPSSETRGAEAATVAWMMSVVTTLVCGATAALVLGVAGGRAGMEHALLFGRLLHFGAFISAAVSLVLLAVVLKTRQEAPPPAITWGSIAIALAAILSALLY